jgi:hypothetical protein
VAECDRIGRGAKEPPFELLQLPADSVLLGLRVPRDRDHQDRRIVITKIGAS